MNTAPTPATLSNVGERAAIDAMLEHMPSSRNGDDAAVLPVPAPNSRTVVSTDTLVEGRHFRLDWSTPYDVGVKAITQNFADIEAMGARPTAALLAVSAPGTTDLAVLTELARGVGDSVERYSAQTVGGDLCSADSIIIGVTAIGVIGGSMPALTLDGARPGQRLVAAGRIGYSAAGLALLNHFGPEELPLGFDALIRAHCAPTIPIGRGVVARATGATAMTDNSDGLIHDLHTMAQRSGVNIDLSAHAIAPDALMIAAGRAVGIDPWEWVLHGGEDHTLLACTNKPTPSGFRTIGKILSAQNNQHPQADTHSPITLDSQPVQPHGWDSFA